MLQKDGLMVEMIEISKLSEDTQIYMSCLHVGQEKRAGVTMPLSQISDWDNWMESRDSYSH